VGRLTGRHVGDIGSKAHTENELSREEESSGDSGIDQTNCAGATQGERSHVSVGASEATASP
jgi:hypothetical protein